MPPSSHNRREFIHVTGAALAAIAGGPELAASAEAAAASTQATGGQDPDLIVINAKVYTMDTQAPRAEAFAVTAGRFTAVGATGDIRGLAGQRTEVFDAKGMTVVPGFIDCHNHARGEVLLNEVLVGNPFEVEFVSIRSIIGKLRERAQQVPPGTWVEGFFFDDTKLSDKRALTIRDLDEVSTEHPVAVRHRGGHTSFYNSKAFAMAGVTKDTPNPMGGTYDKDETGQLTGRVTDRASAPFSKVGTRPTHTPAEAERLAREGTAHISKEFARYGLTSVHHEGGDLPAIQDVRARGELKHRVSYEASGRVLDAMIASGIQTGFGDEWIKFGATSEHTVDGSFSERTMALSTPYPGVTPPYTGNVTEAQDTLNEWVERVHRAGIQVNCHANGDVAIDMYLTAAERALKLVPRANARPKITHCTLVNPSLVQRIKAIGAVPALFTTYAFYNSDKFVYYGEDMMQHCMAFRSLLDAGVYAAAGSDFSPGPFAPLMGIQGMVTRRGWDGKVWGANQKVSVSEAIAINTFNGAWASGEEAIKGSITAGKLADYVVLADDPHTVDAEKIKDIQIVRTVVGGTISHQA
ncbi:MAG TPA: amidohydrolase [Vicinamibacterales bacterium]|nr:amidohydrolase [Vicinamibacterales bacterium]